jgi:hypothetical protein
VGGVLAPNGEAEVEDLDLPVGQDVDVRRLQVTVDDAPGVGKSKALADLLHDRELVGRGLEGLLLDDVQEAGPIEQLHGHVDDALVLAGLEDRDDVRMDEVRRRPRFALEAFTVAVVRVQELGDRLDGDETVEDGVVSLEDLAHRPLTDPGHEAVLSDAGECRFLVFR